MIDYIEVMSLDMQILQELCYTGNHINIFIHRAHYVWFDEYNYCLSIEDKHSPGYLLLWQDPKGHIHDSDLLNLISCELDLTHTSFSDTPIITCDIELTSSGKKAVFIFLDDEDFIIPYIAEFTSWSSTYITG